MLHIEQFSPQKGGERSVAFVRRHWTVLIPLWMMSVVVIGAPIVAYAMLRFFRPEFFEDPVQFTVFVLGLSLVFLYAWLFLYQNYLDYYLDLWIITDKRVIDVEQHGLFARTVSEVPLRHVQTVHAEVTGIIQTFLDYGRVTVETMGDETPLILDRVPRPNHMSKLILDLSEEARRCEGDDRAGGQRVSEKYK